MAQIAKPFEGKKLSIKFQVQWIKRLKRLIDKWLKEASQEAEAPSLLCVCARATAFLNSCFYT